MNAAEGRMIQGRPVDSRRDQRRIVAARKAVETRRQRQRLGLPSLRSVNAVEPHEAGRRQTYGALETCQLCDLLPREQALLDVYISGMQARYTVARLAAIEAELQARGVSETIINAHRFGVADDDNCAAVAIVERMALASADEGWMTREAEHFSPEDFAA